MKKILFAALLGSSIWAYSQYTLPASSPRQMIEQQFSISKITVDYGRPGVKGRTIFGELVPYGKVWRAGANSSTKITFAQSINFGGKAVPAGSYGLFVIPTEKEWTIILNKDFQQWGAYAFDEKQNVVEITVPVQKMTDKQEYFEISFSPVNDDAVDMVFKWDKVKTVVPLRAEQQEMVSKVTEKLREIRQIERDHTKK